MAPPSAEFGAGDDAHRRAQRSQAARRPSAMRMNGRSTAKPLAPAHRPWPFAVGHVEQHRTGDGIERRCKERRLRPPVSATTGPICVAVGRRARTAMRRPVGPRSVRRRHHVRRMAERSAPKAGRSWRRTWRVMARSRCAGSAGPPRAPARDRLDVAESRAWIDLPAGRRCIQHRHQSAAPGIPDRCRRAASRARAGGAPRYQHHADPAESAADMAARRRWQ